MTHRTMIEVDKLAEAQAAALWESGRNGVRSQFANEQQLAKRLATQLRRAWRAREQNGPGWAAGYRHYA